MIRKNFDETVQKVLAEHNIMDEKLEVILIDLFNRFEKHLLHNGFADDVIKHKERKDLRSRRYPKSSRPIR
jgi:hypothetical protein